MKKLYFPHWFAIFLHAIIFLVSPFFVLSQSVTSFTLVNADTKKDIGQLSDGQILVLSALPANLNIRANANPDTTGSVLFSYDSVSHFHIENIPPYLFSGDRPGKYNAWIPVPGNHSLTATPFSDLNATGTKGTPLQINFKIIKDSSEIVPQSSVEISGELKKWHRVTITFNGPFSSETSNPNPFLDYRLDVTFTHSSGKSYKIPGYFAADGNAGETGATSGNKWRVHFSPDSTGTWTYIASFRKGINIAVSDSANEGNAVTPIDSATGSFTIDSSDKTGIDLRARGLLRYVGAPYLQFAETGEYFRKAGTDAPENFLAYADFDNTPDSGSRKKTWAPHIRDWNTGDPTWHNGKGKGIIGAVNYLSAQGMNSFSFLTMNIKGDDKNVYPYISPADLTRIDVSKVDEWEIVFEHAQKMGMHLHFKTQEREGNNILDGGDLGLQRKLYCRELIARFSHHLALNWNVGEENSQTTQQQMDMAKYFWDHDPYKHNIVLHTLPGLQETVYRPLIGTASDFTGVSIQTDTSNVYAETRKWVEASATAGKKWIVANDEQNPAGVGVAADAEYGGNRGTVADNSEQIRKTVLWGNFMAGGAGVEYYFGYQTGETDLSCQDFRSRAKSFRYAKYALDFFKNYLSSVEMKPVDIASEGWSLGKDSEVYVVYLKKGGSSAVNLPSGNYSVNWYNPRAGGGLQKGSVTTVSSETASIGYPPSDSSADWAVLIQRIKPSNNPPAVVVSVPADNATFNAPAKIIIKATASDSDGSITKVSFYNGSQKLSEDTSSPYSYTWSGVKAGLYSITAIAYDNAGDSTVSSAVNITVTKSTAADSIVFAVNAGGTEYIATNGIIYHADTNFTGGKVYKTASTVSNTADDSLYQSERYGNFSYAIPVSNGIYEITFRLAEIYHTASGKRIFDVFAEDSEMINKLDIYAVAGKNTAYDIVKTIAVSDGNLNIQFHSDTDFAKLSALHVKLLNTQPNQISQFRPELTKEETANDNVLLYPNPTSGLINILQKRRAETIINIYDNKGVNVYKNNYAKKAEQINLSALSPGVYFIEILIEGKKTTSKIVLLK